MTINISDTQKVTVWDLEDKGGYTLVRMSSSRYDKKEKEYFNSNWSFVRFVGTAHKKISSEGLKREDRIVLKGAVFALEPYFVNGEKKYPKFPTITVFNWERPSDDKDSGGGYKPPVVESDDDEMPF